MFLPVLVGVVEPEEPLVLAAGGVGRTLIVRSPAPFVCPELPGLGPGDDWPFGPGDGDSPVVLLTVEAPCVGLGLGTPALSDGGAEACETAADGLALGAAEVFAMGAVVGAALDCGGAGVAALVVGAAVGIGFADGACVGTLLGTGLGAAVGGFFMVAAITDALGITIGTAGKSFCGTGS
jgi:hypothetical protein